MIIRINHNTPNSLLAHTIALTVTSAAAIAATTSLGSSADMRCCVQ